MQRIAIIGVCILVALLMCECGRNKSTVQTQEKNISNNGKELAVAKVTISDAKDKDNIYIISLMLGKNLFITPVSQALSVDSALRDNKMSLADMGYGNAFFIRKQNIIYLCTAAHCLPGLKGNFIYLGADIILIDIVQYAKKHKIFHKIDPNLLYFGIDSLDLNRNHDLYIQGYAPLESNTIKFISIEGEAEIYNTNQFKNKKMVFGSSKSALNEKFAVIRLSENYLLEGLSGAPVFNKQGKVVGVVGAIENSVSVGGLTSYYLRINLF